MKTKVSVFLVCFNQEKYIKAAVQGALCQDYPNLEIVVSDDGSTDNTLAIIKEIVGSYRGPHPVKINQNQPNRGIIAHVSQCLELCSGELIVGMAGDDISAPNRVSVIVEAFDQGGRRGDVFCSSVEVIDEHGVKTGERIEAPKGAEDDLVAFYARGWQSHAGASEAWHRRVLEDFGPLYPSSPFEDVLLGFRASLRGALVAIPQVLVQYRKHSTNAYNVDTRHVNGGVVERYQRDIVRWQAAMVGMHADLEVARTMPNIPASRIEMAASLLDRAVDRAAVELRLMSLSFPGALALLVRLSFTRRFGFRSLLRMAVIHVAPPCIYTWFVRRNEKRLQLAASAV